jgi:hypothetical protein
VAQQYAPDPVVGREYYSPGGLGVERVASQRLAGLREVLRGDRGVVPRTPRRLPAQVQARTPHGRGAPALADRPSTPTRTRPR